MQLAQNKKKFSEFFAAFLLNSKYFEKKDEPNRFSKLGTPKS